MNIFEAVRENMEREWLDTEPSPKCFDVDGDRMALLLDFVHGLLTTRGVEEVRSHLLACCRCRYLYTIYRDIDEP